MFGSLNKQEIDDFLRKNIVGRIGCHYDDKTYITPLNYSYDGECIYAISKEGKKLEIMRKNPKVCFEIDSIKDTCNWQSVIIWGTFKELKTEEEKLAGFEVLYKSQLPLISSVITHTSPTWPFIDHDVHKLEGVIFKIVPEEESGRFENCINPPLFF